MRKWLIRLWHRNLLLNLSQTLSSDSMGTKTFLIFGSNSGCNATIPFVNDHWMHVEFVAKVVTLYCNMSTGW